MSIAWKNQDGEWVTISRRSTHTGHKETMGSTSNIDEAYVGYLQGRVIVQNGLTPVEVLVTRKVEVIE